MLVSHNGYDALRRHRHTATRNRSDSVSVPSSATIRTGPSTRAGPPFTSRTSRISRLPASLAGGTVDVVTGPGSVCTDHHHFLVRRILARQLRVPEISNPALKHRAQRDLLPSNDCCFQPSTAQRSRVASTPLKPE